MTLTYTDHLATASSFVDVLAPLVGYRPAPAPDSAPPVGSERRASKSPPAAFLEWLVERDLYLFCTVDELQAVYTSDCAAGAHLIRELHAFGDSAHGRILWVLSGSSSDLRKLATSKWDGGASKYVHYHGLDLNGTKFVPATITPFLSADDYTGLVEFLAVQQRGGGHAVAPKQPLWQLYLQTGGLPGATRAALRGSPTSQYSISAKGLGTLASGDRYSATLKAVLAVLDAHVGIAWLPQVAAYAEAEAEDGSSARPDGGSDSIEKVEAEEDRDVADLAACARWTHWVPLSSVRSIFGGDTSVLEAVCYDLADRGIMRYNDDAQLVSLGSPRVLLDVQDDPAWVTVEEAIALRTRNQGIASSTGDLAGDVTLRLLATQAARWGSDSVDAAARGPSPFLFQINAQPPTLAAGRLDSLVLGGKIKHVVSQVVNRMWREGDKDVLGADGVVLKGTADDLTAYRAQIKVRTTRLVVLAPGATLKRGEDDVGSIIQRFTQNQDTASKQYAAAGLPLARQHWILATTQDVHPSAKAALLGAGITLWDKKWMAKHVWPAAVRRLDPGLFGAAGVARAASGE